jgi:uncharacterized protein (DUF2225 family)
LQHKGIRENPGLVPALLFDGCEVRRDDRDDLLKPSVEIPLMMTLKWIDLRCPCCESVFESMAASSSDDNGQYSIDPSVPATSAAAVLPYLIHVCRRCGYAGGVSDFGDGVEVTDDVRAVVSSELSALRASVRIPWLALTLAGSDKYDGAARIAEWRGDDARRVAELWVRAAWCCLDEDDVEAERYYARHAARWFAKALDVYGEIDDAERASMAYQLGELWLRIGDTKQASAWFARVAEEIVDPEGQRTIMEAAQLQAQRAGRTS